MTREFSLPIPSYPIPEEQIEVWAQQKFGQFYREFRENHEELDKKTIEISLWRRVKYYKG